MPKPKNKGHVILPTSRATAVRAATIKPPAAEFGRFFRDGRLPAILPSASSTATLRVLRNILNKLRRRRSRFPPRPRRRSLEYPDREGHRNRAGAPRRQRQDASGPLRARALPWRSACRCHTLGNLCEDPSRMSTPYCSYCGRWREEKETECGSAIGGASSP